MLSELEQFVQIQKIIEILTSEIKTFFQENVDYQQDLEILLSILGIGETTGAQILSEIPPNKLI